MTKPLLALLLLGCSLRAAATEFHVSTGGNDANDGSRDKPLQTISAAAKVAMPGDTVTVHAGVYRERVNPPRGGESDARRIIYQAAPGEHVEIAGSEVVKHWDKVQGNVWKVTLPNAFFRKFNPYRELIQGDWFGSGGRTHHPGAVYLDGEWLPEATKLDDVLDPAVHPGNSGYLLNVASLAIDGGPGGGPVPADRFAQKQGMKTAPCSEGGQCLGLIVDGDWVRYENFDFGPRAESVTVRAASATRGGTIELRLDSSGGELLGSCPVASTGGWQTWAPFKAVIKPTGGKRTLCLVFKARKRADKEGWFGQVDENYTTVWARFPEGTDPNARQTEINVRQSVFYPDGTGRNYLTVRGFTLRDAATPWAPPTAEQIGLIGTNWSRGWIIENNVIFHSACSGITLGKYGDEHDNKSANSAEGYVQTVVRAAGNGWSKENIGHHVVRHNVISQCEQTGICGSLGAIFSQIVGNEIHDIHVQKLYGGAEMGGIKIHASIDVLIQANHIHHCNRALWMDWMAQGTRITANLCHDNYQQDLFMEVDHGPYLIDNNLFLSHCNLYDRSQGGAYAQNLFAGYITWLPDNGRLTPFMTPHSVALAGLSKYSGSDNRFYNNIFVKPGSAGAQVHGLGVYDKAHVLQTGGNIYYGGAQPFVNEKDAVVEPDFYPDLKLVTDAAGVHLMLNTSASMDAPPRPLVTTAMLGKTEISKAAYENPDASSLRIDTDYFGRPRAEDSTSAGPFANLRVGTSDLEVWRSGNPGAIPAVSAITVKPH